MRRLRNWWSLGAVIGIAVATVLLLYLLWRSPRRDDLATYGSFASTVAVMVFGWLTWAWRKGKTRQPSENLDDVADRLAAAVQAQWKKAGEQRGLTDDPIRVTWGRPGLAMAGPGKAAVGSRRFSPLPGLSPARETGLESGRATGLHALYGGLRSGRLIIAGPPGSGKSGAAVQLVLAALRHREKVSAQERPQVPVPVLLTVQDWNPDRQLAADWLARKLQDTYPLLTTATGADTAAALLAAGRIAVILDGLDEISPDLRPVALQALSQQATFRLVLLSRSSEMAAAAAHQGVLQGAAAVELRPVDPADAVSYLERTQLDPLPAGWQELTRRIQADPASPLSRALDNPLALTLVRDTYQAGDSIHELLEFCDTTLDGMSADRAAEAITDHLLDRVLPAAYTHRPGQAPLPYDLATAQRALIRIAARMNQGGTYDLNWWQITTWAPCIPRIATRAIAVVLTTGLVSGLVVLLVFGLVSGFAGGLLGGLVFGFGFGLVMGLSGLAVGFAGGFAGESGGRSQDRPSVIGDLRLTKALALKNLVYGLAAGILFGLVWGLAVGLAVGVAVGLAGGLITMLTADADSGSSLSPATSWRRNRTYGLVLGLVVGLVVGLAIVLTGALTLGIAGALPGGIAVGIAVWLVAGLLGPASYSVSLASVQIAIEWRIPIRLMTFLDDAHRRNVLRAVGPAYQFRHARLQDRLAALTTTRGGTAID